MINCGVILQFIKNHSICSQIFAKYIQNKSPSEIYCTWDDYIEAFVKEISEKNRNC